MAVIYQSDRWFAFGWLRLAGYPCAVFCLWAVFELWMADTVAAPGRGLFGEPGDRVLLTALVLLAAAVFVGLPLLVSRCYVYRIEWDGFRAVVTTLGVFSAARHVHLAGEFVRISVHHARRRHGDDVPWLALWTAGSRLPYAIDLRASRCDGQRIRALVRARPAAGGSEPSAPGGRRQRPSTRRKRRH